LFYMKISFLASPMRRVRQEQPALLRSEMRGFFAALRMTTC
jgi:hypothetical protein